MRRCAAAIVLAAASAALAAEPQPPAQARVCAPCHGPLGVSVQPDAPNLAGQPRAYLAAQLAAYRSGKRAHEVMGVVAKPLTDADISDLAAWFASLEIALRKEP